MSSAAEALSGGWFEEVSAFSHMLSHVLDLVTAKRMHK